MQYKLIAALAAALICSPAQADIVSVNAGGVLFFGVDPSGIFGGGVNLTGDSSRMSESSDSRRQAQFARAQLVQLIIQQATIFTNWVKFAITGSSWLGGRIGSRIGNECTSKIPPTWLDNRILWNCSRWLVCENSYSTRSMDSLVREQFVRSLS